VRAYAISLFFILILSPFNAVISAEQNSASNSANNSAKNKAAQAAELKKLRSVIKTLQNELNVARSSHDKLRQELRHHEKKIGNISSELTQLNSQLKTHTRALRKQQKQEKLLRSELHNHRSTLKQQVRSAYTIGNQGHLKLLLNQQSPATLGRVLSYYDYFIKVRAKNINEVTVKLTKVEKLQASIKQEKFKLEQIQHSLSEEKQALGQTKKRRVSILAKLDKDIRSKGQKLGNMLEDEKRLERLLKTLKQALPDFPDQAETLTSFARQKGYLQWPVKGRLRAKYGSSRKMGKLRWQGVVINAREGSEVSAISHGQVVFSDWLQGYGLLVIIDHGDNFMSLYGFNQSLYKGPGDWVEAGDIIATVGESGGQTKSGLYFEIRKNGKPTNPSRWCSNKKNKKSARR
jgi:septal ring factor EnvC (AmiA/AmiB activator)